MGWRFAAEVLSICRLPHRPHEVVQNAPLTRDQALFFDVSFLRAAEASHVLEVEALFRAEKRDGGDGTAALIILLHKIRGGR